MKGRWANSLSGSGGDAGVSRWYVCFNGVYPENLRHDKAEKRERVIIQIVVDKKGNATNPVVLRSTNPALDEEALRIVSLMPKWKPGRQAGKNRNVKFAFPVAFKPSVQNTN